MTDKQIDEKLQLIENNNAFLFISHKLKDYVAWYPVVGTDKLTWGFREPLADKLPIDIKNQVSEFMNKMTLGGYLGFRI
ncbi:MAG: hypothetical protein ACLQQ4_16945 [Bacteroidia bacterium]